MTMSWKNFFFASFDPGGFISVDKQPVFLWFDAISARLFGYSTWSLLLPSSIAGATSVALLWVIVRRYFGVMAATIAGLALALTPVSVAVDRLNLPEPFMILALVGAAAALMQSLESRRWWAWTALSGALVGVAFNTKMLAAWIPGPAFVLALVFATRSISWSSARQLAARLAVLGAVTLAVSASWIFVVDAWPASDRPYVGGSTDNTALDLALGYNGFSRVDGADQGAPGGGAAPRGGAPPGGRGPGGTAAAPTGGGVRGPGGIFGGFPGALRMFDDANGGQIGWLLPFAIGGGLIALWHWRGDPSRRAFAALFLGWVGLYGGVFSYAHGIFHSYYTSAMAPGVAALVAIGVIAIADLVRHNRRWLLVAVALIAFTAWSQLQIADRTPDFYAWLRPVTVGVALAAIAVASLLAFRRLPVAGALAAGVGGLLLLPAAWSVSAASNASLNATLPQAGPQAGVSGGTFGSLQFDDGSAELAVWLVAHGNAHAKWDVAVATSQSGSRLIAQYDLSVMALGGFLGRDNTIGVRGFADLVAAGDVRYVLTSGGFGPGGGGRFGSPRRGGGFGAPRSPGGGTGSTTNGAATVSPAVETACTKISDPSLPARYAGTLYDCAGKADALRAIAR